ncbi:MAG TPA: hypothetical protein VFU15_03790 [Bacteroidia bacterium]|nr:hypothetical protein [Bacteroidia bacterium]
MIRKILSNFSARMAGAVLNFFMLLLTTHFLGKSVRGEIVLIQIGINIIHLVSDLAGGPSLVYLVPRARLSRLLSVGSAWGIGSSVLVAFAMISYGAMPENYTWQILVMGALISLHSLNQNILLGQERITAYNALLFAQGIVQTLVMTVCIIGLGQRGALPYIWCCIIGYGLCWITGLFLVWKGHREPKIEEKRNIFLLLFSNGFFTQMASLAMLMSIRINYYMLHKYMPDGDSSVGLYSTAISLGEAILLFSASISAIIMSRVSNESDHRTARSTVLRLSKVSLGMTALGVCAFLVLPDGFYSWLLGKDFSPVKEIFTTIAPGVIILSFATVFSHYFSGSGLHYLNFISGAVAILCTFIVAGPLISDYGIPGAGWAASISYGTLSLTVFFIFMLVGGNRKEEWKMLLPSSADFSLKNYRQNNF